MTFANDIYTEHSNRLNKKPGDKTKIDGQDVDSNVGTTNFEEKIKRFKSLYNN